MAETIHLWVYGTLKAGGRLHHAMRGALLMARCRTVAGYQLLHLGWYPGLVRLKTSDPRDTVAGELYEVPTDMLEKLDEVEGAPTLFRREPVVLTDQAHHPQAYFYQGSTMGLLTVAGGEWPVG